MRGAAAGAADGLRGGVEVRACAEGCAAGLVRGGRWEIGGLGIYPHRFSAHHQFVDEARCGSAKHHR